MWAAGETGPMYETSRQELFLLQELDLNKYNHT